MRKLVERANLIVQDFSGVAREQRLQAILEKAQEHVMDLDTIPLEQLKGDIARAGHQIKQALALDVEGRRLFFTDGNDQYLFAEFGTAKEGHRVKRIGLQATIAKEYDVQDLEPSTEDGNLGETVTTTHAEADVEEDPEEQAGVYPSGTPGDKPEEDDRGFSADEKLPTRKALIQELCACASGTVCQCH